MQPQKSMGFGLSGKSVAEPRSSGSWISREKPDNLVGPLRSVAPFSGLSQEALGFRMLAVADRGKIANQSSMNSEIVVPSHLGKQLPGLG